MPGIDCDSMRSMPLTVVENARSLMRTTRRSMSCGRQARVVPDDGDDRDVDGREDVDHHAGQRTARP